MFVYKKKFFSVRNGFLFVFRLTLTNSAWWLRLGKRSSGNKAIQLHDQYHAKYLTMKKAKFSWDEILKINFDSQLHKRTDSSLGPYNETFQGHNWIQILGSHRRRSWKKKKCSWKFSKIHRKAAVSKSLF